MLDQELDHITIEGFKSIASLEEVSLRPINVLIGPNGSGKSNFISVFAFLNEIREGRLYDYVRKAGGADQLLHFGSKKTNQIRIELSFREGVNTYALSLGTGAEDDLYPESESVGFWNKEAYPSPYTQYLSPHVQGREAGISDQKSTNVASWVQLRMSRWRVYHIHDTSNSSPMRKTAKLSDNGILRADGSNLAAFLYLLQEKHPNSYSLIVKTIQRVAPFFLDFDLKPDPLNEDSIRLAWTHKNSDQYFGASAFSDGTLRFVVLATLFLQPISMRPSIIIVDEPELGLHPYAVTLLASLVRQAAKNGQVILSTQSPQLLDQFDPEDVLVAERRDGSTNLVRLNSEQLEDWLETYSLGQLWEKNELGGRPERD